MSVFNRAIGAFDALMGQAKYYKLDRFAARAKSLATDVATRSGGWTGMRRHGMVGAGLGVGAGAAYGYYSGDGSLSSTLRGGLTGGLLGGVAGMGYRGMGGLRSSFRSGELGQYASSMRSAFANRVSAARSANAVM